MYRICIKNGRKWLIGRIEYADIREASLRAEYFRSMGRKVKIVTNQDLGLSK